MIERIDTFSRKEWLKERGSRIGGSDIACVMGMNPWKTNVQLWREKMGIEVPDDLSGNEAVSYGVKAEPIIRDIFKLNHEEIKVDYVPNNLWLNDEYPFAHASLDGWLKDGGNETGVLEIKTGTVMTAAQRNNWKNRIPDHYYCQVLWYMMVTGARYAWVTAMLKVKEPSGEHQEIRDYEIRRDWKIEGEIGILAEKGKAFWDSMNIGIEPPLILPFEF